MFFSFFRFLKFDSVYYTTDLLPLTKFFSWQNNVIIF